MTSNAGRAYRTPAPPRNESQLVNRIRSAIAAIYPNVWIFKVVGHPYQVSGVPDLICCIHGRLVGLEVKHQRPGESPVAARARATPLQLHTLETITNAGGIAAVVISVEEALDVIEAGLRPTEKER